MSKVIPLDQYLQQKSERDGHNYDYGVSTEGPTGFKLKVYRVEADGKALMFEGSMHSHKTRRTSDLYYVSSGKATYEVYFFM